MTTRIELSEADIKMAIQSWLEDLGTESVTDQIEIGYHPPSHDGPIHSPGSCYAVVKVSTEES